MIERALTRENLRALDDVKPVREDLLHKRRMMERTLVRKHFHAPLDVKTVCEDLAYEEDD